jgi:alkanesulfonate monooxygenase SsuD/methylene tetrahydromethanopterin reductase-like flavin-dependent oxidoreductase (luciferase family)
VRFGLQLHADRGVDAVLQEARLADEQGFDSVWTGDHLITIRGEQRPDQPLETWTLMTAIGATTARVRVAFATLNPSFRNPALLAKMLATLDQITHGRVICTLGAGWFQDEYTAYDIPFIDDHDARIDHEREVARLLKLLWTRPAPARVTFQGRYVRATELPFSPAPFQQPHPPIWIGGNSPATHTLVKELGDGWILLSAGGMREVVEQARSAPDWPSRELTIVGGAHVFSGETREAAQRAAREAFEAGAVAFVPSLDALMQSGIIGTREHIAERFDELATWGINYLRLTFADAAQQTYFAEHVLPHVSQFTGPRRSPPGTPGGSHRPPRSASRRRAGRSH